MADQAALRDRAPPLHRTAPRRIGPPRRASRLYSRFVAVMKIALPLTAAATVALIFAWPRLFPSVSGARSSFGLIGVEELARSRMVNPRFRGVDDQGQPFSLSADVATPSPTDPDLTDLENPRGDMTRTDGSWISLTADRGTYDRTQRLLDLGGRVSVFHDDGYEMQTTQMHFDMATSIVHGDQAVAGQGPNAEFQSEGFRIEDRGMRVFLTGQARVVIYQQPDDGQLGLPDIPTSAPRPAASAPAAPAAPNTPAARRRDLP
jgi:lipopolysaccharide export system protein LptC